MSKYPLKQAKAELDKLGWNDISVEAKTSLLSSKWWRMDNLYYIRDDDGQHIRFVMKPAQRKLLGDMWYMNLILKARQIGFTTFVCIYFLDECLFNAGVEAGIVAHTQTDVAKIFRRKIKYPYDHLPSDIKEMLTLKTDSKTELHFANDSIISVGVSFRSSTAQYLHISEFGKICAKFPDKAEEIVTGALEALAVGQILFIESTAEGKGGYFYEYCKEAKDREEKGDALTKLDYKIHFFPWWEDRRNRLDDTDTSTVLITQEKQDYFDDLSKKRHITLDDNQKAWYVKKESKLKDKMKREHPSYWQEAFEASIKGAYWGREFSYLRRKRQITNVPHDPALLVHTGWDLGRHDTNPIWFFQEHAGQMRFIDFHEENKRSLAYYVGLLRDKKEEHGYNYGMHYLPHDIEVTDISQANDLTRKQVLEKLGMTSIETVKREGSLYYQEGIDAARIILPRCWFDEKKCEKGITALEAYSAEWDEKNVTFKRTPVHNWASHPSSAFIQIARGYTPMVEYTQMDIDPEEEASF